jgi:hypothetical protein
VARTARTSHISRLAGTAGLLALLVLLLLPGLARAQADPCAGLANPIPCENQKQGTSPSIWDIPDAGSPEIQGFATDISVNQGQTVQFKISSQSSQYRIDIYRMGYYGGDGARRVATIQPLVGMSQQACPPDATGLIDCGHWSVSASWNVPADAVSGIYFAHLVRMDGTPGESHIVFVVRDDDGRSDLLFQTSDTTWQAYNEYGGNSLYTGSPGENPGRSYKVSYNRPFTTRSDATEDWVFNAEYPMVRWLERNGYDVSYFTGVDADRLGAELLEHRAFLSVGHDEYWSGRQRANVEAARNAGVNLALFSGNEVFWKTRWEGNYRHLVSYKETHANANIDPSSEWTGTWRDRRSINPEGGRPENALTGTIFTVNCCTVDLQVPAAEGQLRFWRNAGLGSGTATLGSSIVGYEWDEDLDNGARPPGLIRLSSTTENVPQRIQDEGSSYGPGDATHSLTLYRDTNGPGADDALVFGAGTVQWSWGLDSDHDRGPAPESRPVQQATLNLFADMGVQPATKQADLVAASASTDLTPPTSSVTNITGSGLVSGAAQDLGGGRVAGVEVSVDGGSTWHPANGRESWTYAAPAGTQAALSRATDDSANLQGTAPGGPGNPPGGDGSSPGQTPSPGGSAPPSSTTPPAKPKPPAGGSAKDSVAPRVKVRRGRVRVSVGGYLVLRASCPRGERSCRVVLKLKRGRTTLTQKTFTVSGGQSRELALRLTRAARRRLAASGGSLRVIAAAAARDAAGNRATTETPLVLVKSRR